MSLFVNLYIDLFIWSCQGWVKCNSRVVATSVWSGLDGSKSQFYYRYHHPECRNNIIFTNLGLYAVDAVGIYHCSTMLCSGTRVIIGFLRKSIQSAFFNDSSVWVWVVTCDVACIVPVQVKPDVLTYLPLGIYLPVDYIYLPLAGRATLAVNE